MVRPKWAVRVDELRDVRGLQQQDVADGISRILSKSVSVSKVKHWEQGDRAFKVDDLIALATYFDCTPDYLLGYTESTSPNKNLQFTRDHTGLTDDAIEVLNSQKSASPLLNAILSDFLTSDCWKAFAKDMEAATDFAALAEIQEKSKEELADVNELARDAHIQANLKDYGFQYGMQKPFPAKDAKDFYIDRATRVLGEYLRSYINKLVEGEENHA